MKQFKCLTAIALIVFSPAFAQTIDPTFGTNGVAVTEVTSGVDALYKMVQQPDGKITAIGIANNQIALIRYLPDGTLDATFAANGIKTTGYNCGFVFRAPVDIDLQTDNKILIAGGEGSAMQLVRYESDGALDSSFGINGVATLNGLIGTNNSPWFSRMHILNDGKIMIIGSFQPIHQMFLVRCNADGSFDTTFGTNGLMTIATPENHYGFRGIDFFQQADGNIVVGANVNKNPAGYSGFCMLRVSADGQLDTGFATNGFVYTDIGGATAHDRLSTIKQQPDGKIVLAGTSSTEYAVARYNADGAPDTTFDTDGIASVTVGGSYRECSDMLIKPNGKIVLAGYVGDDFASVRYKANGTPDTDFGTNGVFKIDFGNSYDYGSSIIKQSDGKFVMAGWTSFSCSDRGFALTRFISPDSDENVGIEPSGTAGVICYPNPTKGNLFIETGFDIKNVTVLDMQGKALLSSKNKSIDISSISSGIYLINVTFSNHENWSSKIIKE